MVALSAVTAALVGGGTAWAVTQYGTSSHAVRQAVLADPAMIPDAMDALRGRERADAVAANAQALRTPFRQAVAGNRQSDVTVVEFFDYACGYCRRSQSAVHALLRDDPQVRLVYRELPILGESSQRASIASLKAAATPRYAAFHDALFALSPEQIGLAAQRAGLPAARLAGAPDVAEEAEIRRNLDLARALGVSGTPAWVIGNRVIDGALDEAALKAAVAEARAGRTGRAGT